MRRWAVDTLRGVWALEACRCGDGASMGQRSRCSSRSQTGRAPTARSTNGSNKRAPPCTASASPCPVRTVSAEISASRRAYCRPVLWGILRRGRAPGRAPCARCTTACRFPRLRRTAGRPWASRTRQPATGVRVPSRVYGKWCRPRPRAARCEVTQTSRGSVWTRFPSTCRCATGCQSRRSRDGLARRTGHPPQAIVPGRCGRRAASSRWAAPRLKRRTRCLRASTRRASPAFAHSHTAKALAFDSSLDQPYCKRLDLVRLQQQRESSRFGGVFHLPMGIVTLHVGPRALARTSVYFSFSNVYMCCCFLDDESRETVRLVLDAD